MAYTPFEMLENDLANIKSGKIVAGIELAYLANQAIDGLRCNQGLQGMFWSNVSASTVEQYAAQEDAFRWEFEILTEAADAFIGRSQELTPSQLVLLH